MNYIFRFIIVASTLLDINFLLVIFLVAITTYLTKQLKKGMAYFGLQFVKIQFILDGKTWQQKH